MNANELADELEKSPTLWFKDDVAGKWIIDTLRNQANDIVQLKLEWQVWSDQNLALRDRIAYLESQVYGGATK